MGDVPGKDTGTLDNQTPSPSIMVIFRSRQVSRLALAVVLHTSVTSG
jgi:hypothetical protein